MNTADRFHVVCANCGATNRIPAVRLADDPECGKCHRPLLTGKPIDLDDGNFEKVTSGTDLPVVVDFWAPWCGPCRMMAPQFEEAARQLKGKALLVKVNSDESPRAAQRFGIRSIPTMVRLTHGREADRLTGAVGLAQIMAFVG